MTLTIDQIAQAFEKRFGIVTVDEWASEIRATMDYAKALVAGKFFKSKHDLEYQIEKYFENNYKCVDIVIGMKENDITDFTKACLVAAEEELNDVGTASIVTVSDIDERIFHLYEKGFDPGISLRAWPSFSNFFRTVKKQLCVLTGYGGAGKSTWLDNYLCGLARERDWKTCFYSPENFPVEYHFEKLASIYCDKPFLKGSHERMTPAELSEAMGWIHSHFHFISSDDNATLDVILAMFKQAIEKHGVDCCVIDPWNTVEHKRPKDQQETEYICECLTKCIGFTRRRDVAMWIVAHPAKTRRDKEGKLPAPGPYDISGSAHWANRPDASITIHNEGSTTKAIVNKVRFRMYGRTGEAKFTYNRVTNVITEIGGDDAELPY